MEIYSGQKSNRQCHALVLIDVKVIPMMINKCLVLQTEKSLQMIPEWTQIITAISFKSWKLNGRKMKKLYVLGQN